MKNEVASLMNNEKLMKIFAVAKINQNYSLFTIHYSFLISHTLRGRDVYRIKEIFVQIKKTNNIRNCQSVNVQPIGNFL